MKQIPIMSGVVVPERRRAGPVPHLRRQVPDIVKIDQGMAVARLVASGSSIRGAAGTLGLSVTTAWRRYWLITDWTLPGHYGLPCGPIPPQRATRACPAGQRPFLPTLDGAPPPAAVRIVKGLPMYFGPGGRNDFVWTTGAIARRMGLSRERVRQLTHTAGFPPPVGRLYGARAWATNDIDEWIRVHRPELADS